MGGLRARWCLPNARVSNRMGVHDKKRKVKLQPLSFVHKCLRYRRAVLFNFTFVIRVKKRKDAAEFFVFYLADAKLLSGLRSGKSFHPQTRLRTSISSSS